MNSVVIVAGGSGTRFGGDIPKQFIKIDGQEILSFSVKTFQEHPKIDEVIIVSHPEWIDHVSNEYSKCKVVKGGVSRRDSSLNGVAATSAESINVLIHDAARPFVTEKIISNCLSSLGNYDGVAPIIPATDSLIQWDGQNAHCVKRENVQIVQTPQCFQKIIISTSKQLELSVLKEI